MSTLSLATTDPWRTTPAPKLLPPAILTLPPLAVTAPDVYTPFADPLLDADAPAMFTSPEAATVPANKTPALALVAEPMDITPAPEILPP